MRRTTLSLLLPLLLLAACDAAPRLNSPDDAALKSDVGRGNGQFVSVMTRNLYLGTDIGEVISPPPGVPLPVAVWMGHREVIASDPAERMARIADEIAAARPDLVGLQEVAQFFTQTPGDVLLLPTLQPNPNQQPATTLQYDFLQLLLEALEQRGASYRVVTVNHNADVEMPAVPLGQSGAPQFHAMYDVRMVMRDAVLARNGVKVEDVAQGHYAAALPLCVGGAGPECAGGIPVTFSRGWQSVDARVHGRTIRFVNTHLETQDAAPINVLQARELAGRFAASELPVVMVGDFNSAANESAPADRKTAAYPSILGAGFQDLWSTLHPGAEGITCCHDEHLRTTGANWNQRIDLVFFKGGFGDPAGVRIVGEEAADRTASGLWPSDHAGLFGQIRLK